MRRALRVGEPTGGGGSGGGQEQSGGRGRPARHYAQDGDVPVVRLPPRKDHAGVAALAKAEEALQEERAAREKVEMALRQAQATIQTLQTKIAHAEIAHAEELTAQRTAAELAHAEDLAAQRQAAEAAHAEELAALRRASEAAAAPKKEERHVRVAEAQTPKPVAEPAEPEPVEWWVAGWRERLRRR